MRGPLVLAVAALVPLGVLADTALAWGAGWTLRSRLDQAVVLGAGALLAVLGLAGAVPGVRARVGARAPELALGMGALLGAALVGEGVLGFALPDADLYHRKPPGLRSLYAPDPTLMRGLRSPSRYTINSWGLRGPEPPATGGQAFRVVCVGGSTTENLYLDDDAAWPELVRRGLVEAHPGRGVWLASAGMGGYDVPRHRRFLESWERLAAVDALVLLVGVNDLQRSLQGEEPVEVAPAWTRTSWARVVRLLLLRARAGSDPAIEDARGFGLAARRARRGADRRGELPAGFEAAVARFREDLEGLVDLLRARGKRVVLVTQPALWAEDLPAGEEALLCFGRLAGGGFLAAGALRRALERFNAATLAVGSARGVGVVDLAPMHGRGEWFYDDCHFTEAGSREVARRVLEAIRARDLLGLGDPAP